MLEMQINLQKLPWLLILLHIVPKPFTLPAHWKGALFIVMYIGVLRYKCRSNESNLSLNKFLYFTVITVYEQKLHLNLFVCEMPLVLYGLHISLDMHQMFRWICSIQGKMPFHMSRLLFHLIYFIGLYLPIMLIKVPLMFIGTILY